MENAMSHYEKELASIRTSRASVSMLDNIMVDAYNSKTPISQLANISVPDSSTLTIQVWDNSLTKNIETSMLSLACLISGMIPLLTPRPCGEKNNKIS